MQMCIYAETKVFKIVVHFIITIIVLHSKQGMICKYYIYVFFLLHVIYIQIFKNNLMMNFKFLQYFVAFVVALFCI